MRGFVVCFRLSGEAAASACRPGGTIKQVNEFIALSFGVPPRHPLLVGVPEQRTAVPPRTRWARFPQAGPGPLLGGGPGDSGGPGVPGSSVRRACRRFGPWSAPGPELSRPDRGPFPWTPAARQEPRPARPTTAPWAHRASIPSRFLKHKRDVMAKGSGCLAARPGQTAPGEGLALPEPGGQGRRGLFRQVATVGGREVAAGRREGS